MSSVPQERASTLKWLLQIVIKYNREFKGLIYEALPQQIGTDKKQDTAASSILFIETTGKIPEGDQGQQEGQQATSPAAERTSLCWEIQHKAPVRVAGEAGSLQQVMVLRDRNRELSRITTSGTRKEKFDLFKVLDNRVVQENCWIFKEHFVQVQCSLLNYSFSFSTDNRIAGTGCRVLQSTLSSQWHTELKSSRKRSQQQPETAQDQGNTHKAREGSEQG